MRLSGGRGVSRAEPLHSGRKDCSEKNQGDLLLRKASEHLGVHPGIQFFDRKQSDPLRSWSPPPPFSCETGIISPRCRGAEGRRYYQCQKF